MGTSHTDTRTEAFFVRVDAEPFDLLFVGMQQRLLLYFARSSCSSNDDLSGFSSCNFDAPSRKNQNVRT